jgi:type II secretory pathway pseudopilin PulG
MTKRQITRQATRQSGVTLLIALIMLVVIGLASVAIVRKASNSDAVSENARRQNQAMQAAQAALLYCEQQIASNKLSPDKAAPTPNDENWKTFSNWAETNRNDVLTRGGPLVVPVTALKTNGVIGSRYGNVIPLPRCMAQNRTVGTDAVIVVTAIGYSDDFTADKSTGQTLAGATVWLQSFVRFASDS